MQKQEKELDLLDIIRLICGFLKKYFFYPMITVIKLGLRKWYFLLSAIIVGLVISFVMPKVQKKCISELVLKNNVSVSTEYINELQSISDLSPEKKSNVLGIDLELAKTIRAIRPHRVLSYDTAYVNKFVDKDDVYDKMRGSTIVHPNLFSLEIVSNDVESLPEINNAIIDYFNEKSLFSRLNENRLSSLKKELTTYKKEIRILDSIRSENRVYENSSKMYLDGIGGIFSAKEQEDNKVKNTILELSRKVISIESTLCGDSKVLEVASTINVKEKDFFSVFKLYTMLVFIFAYVLLILYTYRKEIVEWIYTDTK